MLEIERKIKTKQPHIGMEVRAMAKARKTWREKLEVKQEPRVVDSPGGRGKMLIPTPLDVDAPIHKVEKGKPITDKQIRERLARNFHADLTCPMTTGIFIHIAAEIAEEDLRNGRKQTTPYWQVIKRDSSLNEKFPGGVEAQATIGEKKAMPSNLTRAKMQYSDILEKLKSLSNPRAVESMARYGITLEKTYGVSIPNLRKTAKEIVTDHELAQQLWASGIRETWILASMIEDPEMVTKEQMESWAKDFEYWEICDQCCQNLFEKTKFAYQKATEWSSSDREFTKRAGFVLM